LSPFPQRLSLNLCGGLWACERDERGSARVVFERHRPEALVHEAWILWDGSREPIALQAGLPQGQDLPLVLGDWLQGSASARTPWWSDLAIELAAPSGLVVYRQEDRAFEVADPQGRCPPHLDPAGCGRRVYPILADGREQGLARVLEQGGALRHQWVGQLWQFLEMNCDDVPMGWIQSAEVSYARRSACRCAGPADCARDEICEPYAKKCVRNPCVVMDCTPGHVCDPFRGECVPRADPGCGADADCGPDEICHPVTRACVYDFCRFVDCAPCSPLLGGCYGCLHDCDCWPGVCDREARGCVDGCFLDKLDQQLRPENPSAYDYYRVCLEDALEDPAAVLRLFEPAVGCGVQPTPNTCPAGAPVACIVPLERYPNQPTITWEAWQRLCHLSRNPLVHRLVGGHYLP